MVLIRRHFLSKELRNRLDERKAERIARGLQQKVEAVYVPWWKRSFGRMFSRHTASADEKSGQDDDNSTKKTQSKRLRTDMIRRMDDTPKLVTPSGFLSEGRMPKIPGSSPMENELTMDHGLSAPSSPRQSTVAHPRAVNSSDTNQSSDDESDESFSEDEVPVKSTAHASRRLSDPGTQRQSPAYPIHRFQSMHRAALGRAPSVTRSQTVEFAPSPPRNRRRMRTADGGPRSRGTSVSRRQQSIDHADLGDGGSENGTTRPPLPPGPSLNITRTHHSTRLPQNSEFGGFPMPLQMMSNAVSHFFPNVEKRIRRTVTIPRSQTIVSQHGNVTTGTKVVPYITFDAVVGRNSMFHMLTSDQIEELCGVEYKALTALLWIVPTYHIMVQLIAFTIISPYMSMNRWESDFRPPNLYRNISPLWFSLFQVVSAYTNTGMSLVDQSMVPFQRAYPMILIMALLILAGNTAFFKIYDMDNLQDNTQESKIERAFETWFLAFVVCCLTFTDWFFFLVLDIGNTSIGNIPAGVRVIIGLLQATAVRSAGFATVPLAALVPAVKVLYALMMYVSVYPIAMSVRSTNVYEEKSLGIYDAESIDEDDFQPVGSGAKVWSEYLALHMRKQLSFDMWWLALALFLVCIIEKDGLENEANASWFNIFTIIFELISAYGTVGLSLGLPNQNYSFAGALRPLSRLIICLVMLRGRHRGMPVAIDRAVMLPDIAFEDARSSRRKFGQHPSSNCTSPAPDDALAFHPSETVPKGSTVASDKDGKRLVFTASPDLEISEKIALTESPV